MPLFKKCEEYVYIRELVDKGIYPYFHELESKQDIEVMMVGILVLGAKAPIVLTSRADSDVTKLNSIALGVLAASKND